MQSDINQERHIVLYCHVNGVFQRIDLKEPGILLAGAVDGIVQRQQLFFLAEQHRKNAGLILAVHRVLFRVSVFFHRKTSFFAAQEISPKEILYKTSGHPNFRHVKSLCMFSVKGKSIEISHDDVLRQKRTGKADMRSDQISEVQLRMTH